MGWASPQDATAVSEGGGVVSGEITGVELEDNTAVALSIGEGATDYITIDTVNAAERIDVLKNTHWATGRTGFIDILAESTTDNGVVIEGMRIRDERIDLNHGGTSTGDAGVLLKDNLANAWDFREGSTVYQQFVTTDGSEAVHFGKPMTTTDGVASGAQRKIGGAHTTHVDASTAITGATENVTNFSTAVNLVANALKVGTKCRLHARGIITSINLTDTFVLRFAVAGSAVSTTPTITPVAANTCFTLDVDFECRAVGASGTLVGDGEWEFFVRDTASLARYKFFFGSTTTSTTTVDTTGAISLAIAMDWMTAANDSNSIRLDGFALEMIG